MITKKEKTFHLCPVLFEMCIGVLLGDASIQKNTSKSVKKHRLKFLQSSKHKEYVMHLHQQFVSFVRAPVYYDEKRDTFAFQTLFDPEFNKLADIFLNASGKKIVGEYFKEHPISPICLAYWFMDDGGLLSYSKKSIQKGLVLNTQGFSFDEVNILCDNLNNTYNLDCWVKKNKGKPVICISGKRYKEFEYIALPNILPCMQYKLPKV